MTTNGNTQTTSKSNTTLTVSGSVAPASIDANGSTAYFANVTQAIASLAPDATEKTQISVFGNSTISTDVELQENITLVVAPGVQLTADVTSGESEMVVITEQDANGNTVYKLVANPKIPNKPMLPRLPQTARPPILIPWRLLSKRCRAGRRLHC